MIKTLDYKLLISFLK